MDQVGQRPHVFADVDRGHEAVAVGDQIDALVFGGGDGELEPGRQARVILLCRGLLQGAHEQDIGSEFDQRLAADIEETLAGDGAGILAARRGDHFIDKRFAAAQEHQLGADQIDDFGMGRIFVLRGEVFEIGLRFFDGGLGFLFHAGGFAQSLDAGPDVIDAVEAEIDQIDVFSGGEIPEPGGDVAIRRFE